MSLAVALIALDRAVPLLLPDLGPLVMMDPVLGWRAKPRSDCRDFSTLLKDHRVVRYQIGSWGERRNRLDVEPRVHHRRLVLCFGDSMTFGQGVNNDEAYPQALEKELNRSVTVMNFGMPGFNAWQSYLQATQWCRALPPRLIVFQLSKNDDDPPLPLDVYAKRPWLAISYLSQILNFLINRPSGEIMRNSDAYAASRQMVKVAEQAHAPLIIIVGGTPKSAATLERLSQLGLSATVPLDVFKIQSPPFLRLRSSRHLNRDGGIQLADDLVAAIRQLGLADLL